MINRRHFLSLAPIVGLFALARETKLRTEARFLLALVGSNEDYRALAADAAWLQERIAGLHSWAEGWSSTINVDLQNALGPRSEEADPAAIESACSKLLIQLRQCLEVEKRILTKRLHPDLQEIQFNFAGLTADFVKSHQDLVRRIREFVVKGVGTEFNFTVALDCNRLSQSLTDTRPSRGFPPQFDETPKSSKSANSKLGCLFMVAAIVAGCGMPFPFGMIAISVLFGIWLVAKNA